MAGASALIIAIAALIRSPAALRDWRARQRAQAEAEQERAETARLERRQYQSAWSGLGTGSYGVALVTDGKELAQAARELGGGKPSAYVMLRVDEGGSGDAERARSLRQLIEDEGHISRPPTVRDIVALRKGLEVIGFPSAPSGTSPSA